MKRIFFTLIFVTFSSSIFARQSGIKFLSIAPTASQLAVSESTVATPHGAASLFTNPSLLTQERGTSISLVYTNWISDANNLFGGINLKKGNRAIAFAFYTSGVNGLEQRNRPGESNGDFSIQYLSISGAYAYDFKYFAAGIAGHYLNEEVFPYRATGYAFNLGVASSLATNRIRLGASLVNLGEMGKLNLEATELPSSVNLGIAVDIFNLTHYKAEKLPVLVTIMADYIIPANISNSLSDQDFNPDEGYFNVGLSLEIAKSVEVHTGFKSGENTRPFSFGVGFITEKVKFNYALVPFNTGFGTVHSIGIQYHL